ncbi:unnamed protein product [Linum tenue]|nr:unnamed protein product [Linum tenue]CAI0546738.1 unnamed protein product [Linum tenue]
MSGKRLYLKGEKNTTSGRFSFGESTDMDSLAPKLLAGRWRKALPFKEFPSSLRVAKLASGENVDITMTFDDGEKGRGNVVQARDALREVRIQLPPEMFDLSRIVCGTFVDARHLVLRGVNGSALLFARSCLDQ